MHQYQSISNDATLSAIGVPHPSMYFAHGPVAMPSAGGTGTHRLSGSPLAAPFAESVGAPRSTTPGLGRHPEGRAF